MSSIAEFAFADALLALDELDHTEIADRLRARWPEVGTPSAAQTLEEPQPTKGTGSS